MSAAERTQVEAVVRALPETGFDWSAAPGHEEDALDIAIKEMKQAANPAAYYQEISGNTAPENFSVPTASDLAAFHKVMAAAEETLRSKPEQAQEGSQHCRNP